LEKLSRESVDGAAADLFKDFIHSYDDFVMHLHGLIGDFAFDFEAANFDGDPFGRSVVDIFSRAQSISGYGAGMSKLKEFGIIESLGSLSTYTAEMQLGSDRDSVMYALLQKLNEIKLTAKKIGNAQRVFFKFFFRVLYNRRGDSYMNVYRAIFESYNKYQAEMV